jgi:hypothetical protein
LRTGKSRLNSNCAPGNPCRSSWKKPGRGKNHLRHKPNLFPSRSRKR